MRYLGGLIAALAIVVSACGGGGDSATTSTSQPVTASGGAQEGDVIGVYYTGTLDDGTQFDSNVGSGSPLVFTLGAGQVIAGFEEAVRNRSVGDSFTVRIEAVDAYGERSDDNIIELPADGAPPELEVGDRVPLSNGATVTVLSITADTITVDGNHPLAGEALTFEIAIDSING